MFNLEFKISNALRNENGEDDGEMNPLSVSKQIEKIAAKVAEGHTSGNVMDENGNTIGTWSLNDD